MDFDCMKDEWTRLETFNATWLGPPASLMAEAGLFLLNQGDASVRSVVGSTVIGYIASIPWCVIQKSFRNAHLFSVRLLETGDATLCIQMVRSCKYDVE